MEKQKLLKPHSSDWFEVLEKTDPQQAAMTRQVLSRAGRDDICSVCGDDPAADYEVAGAPPPSTMRLCDDCRDIRSGMHGEKFSPLQN